MAKANTAPLSPLLPALPNPQTLMPRTDIDMPQQILAVREARQRERRDLVELDRFHNTTQLMSLPARTKTILACLGEVRRYQTVLDTKQVAAVSQPREESKLAGKTSSGRNPPKALRRLDLTDAAQYRAVYNDVLLLTSKAYLSTATPLRDDEDAYSYTMKLLVAEHPWM